MPQIDPFNDNAPGLESPASNALLITPSNTEDLAVKPRSLLIGTGGDLRVEMNNGVTTMRVHDGAVLPIRPTRIHATGTTATGIIALW